MNTLISDSVKQNKFFNRISSVEFIVSNKCQNNCAYCYRTDYHKNTPHKEDMAVSVEARVEAFKRTFNVDNSFFENRNVDLFGGDALVIYKEFMLMLDIFKKINPKYIVVPTNGRLLSSVHFSDIEKMFTKFPNIIFSFSVDSPMGDKNRPLSSFGKLMCYEEKINYSKLIEIAKKYKCGFHPMLSFDSPEIWLDQVKFFVETCNSAPYLLEVRHPITKEQTLKAIKNLIQVREYADKNVHASSRKHMNTIYMSTTPRGLSCSALTTLHLYINGDIPFCHRVDEPPYVFSNIYEGWVNWSKAINYKSSYDFKNNSKCRTCSLRKYCNGLCLGACNEYWGIPWIPIDSICNYFKLKYYKFSEKFEDYGIISLQERKMIRQELLEYFTESEIDGLYLD